MLSLTRSCRGAEDEDLRTWGNEHYRIKGTVLTDAGDEKMLEVVSMVTPRKRKAFFVQDVATPASQYAGTLPTVTFLPQDLDLFRGAPADRRSFLDQLLCQVEPDSYQALQQYQQVLKQRNALLKRIAAKNASVADLELWDTELSTAGAVVTLRRLELIETLQSTLPSELAALGEQWGDVKIAYERQTEARSLNELAAQHRTILLTHRDRDLLLQTTGSGPHREDWQLFAKGRELRTWASRGQERVALIALLLLQVAYLELKRGERPVILLDDVCSELDDRHEEALLGALQDAQVFLTGIRVPKYAGSVDVFDVQAGSVTRR